VLDADGLELAALTDRPGGQLELSLLPSGEWLEERYAGAAGLLPANVSGN
jgi:hypothetical protein